MMAIITALQLTVPTPVTAVTYADVPAEVVRISVYEWQPERLPVFETVTVDRSGARAIVRAVAGRRSLVVLERRDGAYLLDGPFAWPTRDMERTTGRRWRRTLIAASAESIESPSTPEWLSAAPGIDGEWPRCFRTDDRRWACWGVTVGESGVILARAPDRLWWALVSSELSSESLASLRPSQWGRLLVVRDIDDEPSALRVRFAHPVAQSAHRPQGLRLDAATVAAARSIVIGSGVVWLTGDAIPAEAWIEVRTTRGGPSFLALQDVADGSPMLPLAIHLDEARPVNGRVMGGGDRGAGRALVALFRIIGPRQPASSSREKTRRVLVTETIADDGGEFHIDGAGDADYEIVAWHPQLGRAAAALPRNTDGFTIRLESPGTVRGRVMSGGKPRGGVDVISVPAPDAYKDAEDLIDLKGGDARTGADGRFAVMVAAGGGGELRVGGGTLPVKRIPLPRVPSVLLDLGDIELGLPLELTIALDQDTSCGVRATGPIGQTGLQIVGATRAAPGLFQIVLPEPGLWAFGLVCGREGHALSPPVLQITPAHAGKEVRFSVR